MRSASSQACALARSRDRRAGEREARHAVGELTRQHAADRTKAGDGDADRGLSAHGRACSSNRPPMVLRARLDRHKYRTMPRQRAS